MRAPLWRALRIWCRLRAVVTLGVLSVGLALVIWFLITDAQNETIEERLGFGLTVEASNTPPGLATANRLPTVFINIAGRAEDLQDVTVEDFVAAVDLAGLEEGSHQLPLRVRSLNDDVRVRSVTPELVEVLLEPVVERTLPITVAVSNPPPLGFEVGRPELAVPTVTVTGIRQLVDLVATVVAPVDLVGATVDVSLPVTVQPRTDTGATVSGVRIDPGVVEVRVPVTQVIFRRTVAVQPLLSGEPFTGYRVAGIGVDPLTVVVVGTLEALQGLTVAETVPVTVDAADATFTRSVAVRPPEGLALEVVATVDVRVRIEPITVQATLSLPVTVENLDATLRAAVFPSAVAVTVIGPAPFLADLAEAGLGVSVDGTGLTAGVHELPVQVTTVEGVAIPFVSPEVVQVIVSPAEPLPSPALSSPALARGRGAP